jgi:general secretion pathway protein G
MRNSRTNRHRGFTLIELLLVMVIIAILASIVVPRMTGGRERANKTAAIAQLSNFRQALSTFEIDNGAFPTTEQNLQSLMTNPGNMPNWHQYMDSVPVDPWGHPYIYRCPGANGKDYDLLSAGPDGQEGTADDVQ